MPWQRLVAEVGGELDPLTGLPCYREVVATVPRQSGKTTLVLSWEVQRAVGWEQLGPQRIAYTAQTGLDARKKLIDDQMPILERHKAALGIRRFLRGAGNEAVEWVNGSRLIVVASTEEAGHGKTIDLAIKDEFFADDDDRRDQALIPAMATRQYGQVLTASTAGTDKSVPLNNLVARGRAAVADDDDRGIAYFEWSAADGDDPDDPAVWWSCMPALGFTITEDVVRQARRSLSDGEFRRAFLNIPTLAESRIIPAAAWNVVCSPKVSPGDSPGLAIDANDDRSAAAIVACGNRKVELVEHRQGMGWLVARCVEIDATQGGVAWAIAGDSPAMSVVPELERAGLSVSVCSPAEFVEASGQFYDAVADRTIAIRRDRRLDDAVAAAQRRQVGDRWAFIRRGSSVDVTPLTCAVVALWADSQSTDPALSVY